jgi:hypothetical protein
MIARNYSFYETVLDISKCISVAYIKVFFVSSVIFINEDRMTEASASMHAPIRAMVHSHDSQCRVSHKIDVIFQRYTKLA